jgi:hypothetical protein
VSYTYGVYNLQLIGPPAAVEWFGAACAVEVIGLNRDDMDRNNLVFKASELVARRFGGMDYDELPERVCPLEFAAPVQVANEWRNPDGTQAYFVTVYDAGRAEGGPEEGGWWFDCGKPDRVVRMPDRRRGRGAGRAFAQRQVRRDGQAVQRARWHGLRREDRD